MTMFWIVAYCCPLIHQCQFQPLSLKQIAWLSTFLKEGATPALLVLSHTFSPTLHDYWQWEDRECNRKELITYMYDTKSIRIYVWYYVIAHNFSCIHRHFKIISNTCSKMCIKDEWNLFSIASDFKWLCKEGSSKVVLITVKPFGWAGEGRIVKPLKCLTDCFSVCYFKQAMSTLLKVKVKGKVDFIVIMLMYKGIARSHDSSTHVFQWKNHQ